MKNDTEAGRGKGGSGVSIFLWEETKERRVKDNKRMDKLLIFLSFSFFVLNVSAVILFYTFFSFLSFPAIDYSK